VSLSLILSLSLLLSNAHSPFVLLSHALSLSLVLVTRQFDTSRWNIMNNCITHARATLSNTPCSIPCTTHYNTHCNTYAGVLPATHATHCITYTTNLPVATSSLPAAHTTTHTATHTATHSNTHVRVLPVTNTTQQTDQQQQPPQHVCGVNDSYMWQMTKFYVAR